MENNTPYKEFGERLRSLRKGIKLTRKQLADMIGLSDRAIDYYEGGFRIPTGDIYMKLAAALNTTTDYLLGLGNPKQRIDDLGCICGCSPVASGQMYLDGVNALLSEGTLSAEDQLDFIFVMEKVLMNAEIGLETNKSSIFKMPK